MGWLEDIVGIITEELVELLQYALEAAVSSGDK